MNIDEVHSTLKRSLFTIIKVAETSIEYYEHRIKELKEVIHAAQRASADEILPKTDSKNDTLGTLAAITNALEEKPKRAGAIPSSLLNYPGTNKE